MLKGINISNVLFICKTYILYIKASAPEYIDAFSCAPFSETDGVTDMGALTPLQTHQCRM